MGKNEIFTSPLGLGLGIGLGTAVGALTIGLISFATYKYMGDNTDDKSRYSSDSSTSSMFSLPESERTSSFTEEPPEIPRYPLPNSDPTGQHRKIRGGRSKKIKRKNKKKKHNTFKK
jgi:hypothetical protein